MEFEIKDGSPNGHGNTRYPWGRVRIGQYFSVQLSGRAPGRARRSAHYRNKAYPSEKWVTRKVGDELRVYRVEP